MSQKKIALIVISAILAVFIILCGVLAYYIFSTRGIVSYNINAWSNLEKTFTYLPSAEEMGEYSDLRSKYLHKNGFLFQSNAYTLRATYSNAEFEKQRDYIEENFSFQETVVDYGEETVERETSFDLDDFAFRMLSLSEYDLSYPKLIVFVGVSEKNNEIAFVFFDDIDLDYIPSSFPKFLIEECGWET